jgi:hypothetical protein
VIDTAAPGAALLDAWAAATFAGDDAASRLAPWLQRWRDEVGEVRGEDPEFEAWATARTDWILLDMGQGAATLDRDPAWRDVADAWVGLFEIWPTDGGPAWIRDRIGGSCLPYAGVVDVRREPEGPAALWELRGVVRRGSFVPCRPAIAYPVVVAGLFAAAPPVDPTRPARLLQAVRRARLAHARTPRMDPRAAFAALIRSAETIAAPRDRRPTSD